MGGGGGGHRNKVKNNTTTKGKCTSPKIRPRDQDWSHLEAGLCLAAAFLWKGTDCMSLHMNREALLTNFSAFSLAQYLYKYTLRGSLCFDLILSGLKQICSLTI